MDIEVAMLTGDSEDVARAVSEELGIDQYFAEVLPEEKDTKVEQLQSEGKFVAMVGATASTTHRRSREQTSVSPSARGPMSPSSRGYHPRRQ